MAATTITALRRELLAELELRDKQIEILVKAQHANEKALQALRDELRDEVRARTAADEQLSDETAGLRVTDRLHEETIGEIGELLKAAGLAAGKTGGFARTAV